MPKLTASQLRANIYKVLDEVLETGIPVEVERRGKRLRIVADRPPSKLDALARRPRFVCGDPDDLVHMDWSEEWKP